MTIPHDLSAEYAQLLKKVEGLSQAARRSTHEESMSPGDKSSWTIGVPTMKDHTVPPAAISLFICQFLETYVPSTFFEKSKRNYNSVENREPILEMRSWLASFLSRQHNEQQGRMTVPMTSIFCLGLVSLILPVFWSVPEMNFWWL